MELLNEGLGPFLEQIRIHYVRYKFILTELATNVQRQKTTKKSGNIIMNQYEFRNIGDEMMRQSIDENTRADKNDLESIGVLSLKCIH